MKISDYLKNKLSHDRFIVKNNKKYYGLTIDYLKRSSSMKYDADMKRLGREAFEYNVWYACEDANMNPLNIKNKDEYVKLPLADYNVFVEKPDFIFGETKDFNNGSRIYELSESAKINAFVSKSIYLFCKNGVNCGHHVVSGDHCNHLEPVMTYTLEMI